MYLEGRNRRICRRYLLDYQGDVRDPIIRYYYRVLLPMLRICIFQEQFEKMLDVNLRQRGGRRRGG